MAVLIYFAILLAAFFFLIVVPQRRRLTAQRALVAALEVGDEVMTTAGIYGTIRSLAEATLELEIAPGVVITVARGAIAQRRGPASEAAPPAATELTEPAEPSE